MKINSNTVFVVTGGASGLGEAVIRNITSHGGKCICFDMNNELGNKLVNELGGDNVYFHNVNVVDEKSVQDGLSSGVSHFNLGLSGVVNCAGIGNPCKVIGKNNVSHPLNIFNQVVQVNLIGTFNVLRLAAPIMSQSSGQGDEKGIIINVASVAAFDGQIGQAAYSASKAGVVGMTLPISRELAQHGIRVNCMLTNLYVPLLT